MWHCLIAIKCELSSCQNSKVGVVMCYFESGWDGGGMTVFTWGTISQWAKIGPFRGLYGQIFGGLDAH